VVETGVSDTIEEDCLNAKGGFMNYEYGTSDCYEFIDRPRGWETVEPSFADRNPICYAFLASLPLWALILGIILWA